MHNDQKPLQKNMSNMVNQWSLELVTCNITFDWIASAQKSSRLPIPLHRSSHQSNSHPTSSSTQVLHLQQIYLILAPHIKKKSMDATPIHTPLPTKQDTTKTHAPPALTEDHKNTLLQLQITMAKYLTTKEILSSHINGLLYRHAMDATENYLVLIIPDHVPSEYSSNHTKIYITKESSGLTVSSNKSTTGRERRKTSANILQTVPYARGKNQNTNTPIADWWRYWIDPLTK